MSNFKIGRVVVISVWAQDVAAAAHFYRDVLGLELVEMHGHDQRPHFKLAGAYLVILEGRPHPTEHAEPQRFPLFALGVDDLDAVVAHLHAHDIPLPWGVEGREKRYVMLHDPAGNLIELVEDH